MDQRHINKLSWAYSTQHYWTLSPSLFDAAWGTADEGILLSTGSLGNGWNVIISLGARPVINLKEDVEISGGIGTANDPFIVKTN